MSNTQSTQFDYLPTYHGEGLHSGYLCRKVHGVEFVNDADDTVGVLWIGSLIEQLDAIDAKEFDMPDDATGFYECHKEIRVRPLVDGIDFGRGHVKRQFCGGHVPRAKYQLRGGNHA